MTLLLESPPLRFRRAAHAATPALIQVDHRVPGLDLARFIACVGVIWFHLGPPLYNIMGHFRMPFFTILIAFVAGAPLVRGEPRSLVSFARSRTNRLLIPFVLWLLLLRMPHLAAGRFPSSYSPNAILLGLGSIHLWFLPFAFCASLVAFSFTKLLLQCAAPLRRLYAIVLLGCGILSACVPVDPAAGMEHFWRYWIPPSGALFMGIGLAVLLPELSKAARSWPRAIACAAACVGLAVASMFVPYGPANFLGTLAGLALFFAGFSAPLDTTSSSWKQLGQLSYGMYLSHGACAGLYKRLTPGVEEFAFSRFAFGLLGSMAISALLLQLPWGRLLVGVPTGRPHPRTKRLKTSVGFPTAAQSAHA